MDINQKNASKLLNDANTRTKEFVASALNAYRSIKWKKVSFIIPTEPIPSHRPRLCGYRVYVPGAAKNQAFFNKYVLPTLNGLFIDTPCRVHLDLYVKTPKSFSNGQKILAEMKVLRPWGNIGDVDNFAKSIFDQMQPNEKRGHVGIMSNDSLIVDSDEHKYYSMTPRTEVTIEFMGHIPEKLRKVLRLLNQK
jgi:Holliday junction resolvase RusA-like endonuclease